MALWVPSEQSRVETNGITATTTLGVAVTASATPHTKGSWVTLVASTSFDVDLIDIFTYVNTSTSGVDTSQLLDIGIGGAGSEVVLIGNIPRGHVPSGGHSVMFPVRIPAGSRIAGRLQSAVVSGQHSTGLILSASSGWNRSNSGGLVTTYGADTATSSGAVLADTGSANTKAAWTQITAATTSRHRFLVPVPSLAAGDTSITTSFYLYDIGIGAAASEVAILSNIPLASNAIEDIRCPTLPPLLRDIPEGTRLSARFQKGTVAGEPLSMTILGID
jgi:hypothetical protein